jgi:hypothetical protein
VSTPTTKQEEAQNHWDKYEQRKAELPKDLTPDEYRIACRQIADELGI